MSDPKQKIARKLKARITAIKVLKQVCQTLGWACCVHPKIYSDEATMGYLVGDPTWVEYARQVLLEDLEKEMKQDVEKEITHELVTADVKHE